jgi:hypothetical protein
MKSNASGRTFAVLLTLSLIVASAVAASPQQEAARPSVLTRPDVNHALRFDTSWQLRDMATEVPAPMGFHEAQPASTLTVSTASNTGTGTYGLTVTGSSGSLIHSTSVSLTVTK